MLKVTPIRGGQLRPYADSVYEYEIESTLDPKETENHCTAKVKPCQNKGSDFSGSCSFPFGLNSFYSFSKIAENKYNYKVCEPYTG